MIYKTRKNNNVKYFYDYGTVTKNDYALFEYEKQLVSDIQDFKNNRISERVNQMKGIMFDYLKNLKESLDSVIFVSIPSSKVGNNMRLIDVITYELNGNDFSLLDRTQDINSAHLDGHTDKHYHDFKNTLAIKPNKIKKVILVDDICTTGKTIDICVDVLKYNSIEVVDIIVLAKTISRTNIKEGNYTLDIAEVALENEYKFSLKFTNGYYIRVRNEKDFNYIFNHNLRFYDLDYKVNGGYSTLPKCSKVFVKVFKHSEGFKIIQVIFKSDNMTNFGNANFIEEKRTLLYSMRVEEYFPEYRQDIGLIIDDLNNGIQVVCDEKIQIGNYVTVQQGKDGICYLLENLKTLLS